MNTDIQKSLDPAVKSHYLKTFTNLELAEVSLEEVEFEGCEFVDSDFSGATLHAVRFIDCSFTACTLSHVKLPSSRFRSVTFDHCKVVGVNWTFVEWSRLSTSAELTFRDCIISESVFFGLELSELVMRGCKAHGVDLREANLKKADLSFTDFSCALFGKTDLSDADFTEATGFLIDVLDNVMTRSKFSRHEAASLLVGLDIEIVD